MDTRPLEPAASAIAAMKPGELYWSVVQPIWKKVSINDGAETFLILFDEVTEDQGLLLAAHWLNSEVCNGGFHQFFSNATGVLAPEALRGFEMLKMKKASEVVKAAIAKFGKLYLREREERRPKLDKMKKPGTERKDWDPFFALDQQFLACGGTAGFAEGADAIVRELRSVFFRSALWRTFSHPDGRAWAVRVGVSSFELRLGREGNPEDPPLIRARESKTPDAEVARLVKEQLAEGFVPDR